MIQPDDSDNMTPLLWFNNHITITSESKLVGILLHDIYKMIKRKPVGRRTPSVVLTQPVQEGIEELVIRLTKNYTEILSVDIMKQNNIFWGGNGVGDRWAKKRFNYSAIYSNKKLPKTYSENEKDEIPKDILSEFIAKTSGTGIIGIYVHSLRTNIQQRPIRKDIRKEITKCSCVVCGTNTDIICDHKNDLYNDNRVLDAKTQTINDFQPLCNHCNLQKRQVCKDEEKTQTIYSAKKMQRYKMHDFAFPWEKKCFDKTDIHCKTDTYWFDPVEFENKIYCYGRFVIPIITEIKRNIVANKLTIIV